jgi:DNA invertase Pin-like site-specific DNA recombinase
MGGFFFTLTAALAGMERRLIGERTKAALAHKKSKSEKTGGDIPYGYDLTPQGLLVKNEMEQRVLRLIKTFHDQGLSLRRICSELEREGHKTKRGNAVWHPQSSAHIIKRGS